MFHVMVVDDKAPIRDWLMYYIQKYEAASSVTSAANGKEAYRRILEQKLNVVFTDIHMSGVDGLGLMSKVRGIFPSTIFITLTSYVKFSYAEQAISPGARGYILKSEMRSSDIQHIVAKIVTIMAKTRLEKVRDVLQSKVADLYETHHNFEQPGVVVVLQQQQGLWPGRPYLAFYVVNDNSLDLRRRMVVLVSASRAPFSAAAMVQEHLYLLLQYPEAEALRDHALDAEAALGECRLSVGVSALCIGVGQLIRVLGEAAVAQEACFFTGGGMVPYSAIHSLPPIDREAAHARKQEMLRLLARHQVEEARGALRAQFVLFGVVGADDVRWAVDTINHMVISMEDWHYQLVTPPVDGWEPPHSFTVCRSRCSAMLEQVLWEQHSHHSRPIGTALNYIHVHYARPIPVAEVAAQLYRSPEHFSRQFKEEMGENFSSCLTRCRLGRAQEPLQTAGLPVASMTVQTGYTIPRYFSRLYKKYKGVSPRAEHRGSES